MSVYGSQAEALRALREQDRSKNLEARWSYLLEHDPELAATLPYVPFVIERGWAIGGTPHVACSVGLPYRFGHPDLVLSCSALRTPAETNSLRAATDVVARRVAEGHRFEPGDRVELGGSTLRFVGTFGHPKPRQLALYACEAVLRFESLFGDVEHDPARPPVIWARVVRHHVR